MYVGGVSGAQRVVRAGDGYLFRDRSDDLDPLQTDGVCPIFNFVMAWPSVA